MTSARTHQEAGAREAGPGIISSGYPGSAAAAVYRPEYSYLLENRPVATPGPPAVSGGP